MPADPWTLRKIFIDLRDGLASVVALDDAISPNVLYRLRAVAADTLSFAFRASGFGSALDEDAVYSALWDIRKGLDAVFPDGRESERLLSELRKTADRALAVVAP
ncbi:MAG TPA: hypothetical protein VGD08_23470 [Stellaceae bacterium]